jgi:hypothetical protein
MRKNVLGIVIVAVLMTAPQAEANWRFISGQQDGRPVLPVAAGSLRINGSSYEILGTDVIPFVRSVCKCYVMTEDFPGPYEVKRMVRDSDPWSEVLYLGGPLAVLGPARISGGRRVAVFQRYDFSAVLVSISSKEGSLWDVAVSEITQAHVVVTPNAMVMLDGIVRDAEDRVAQDAGGSGLTGNARTIASTRAFIREVLDARRSSGGVIDTMQVQSAAIRFCLYPFCRKAQ